MKNLIISTICLLLLIIPWGIYSNYARNVIYGYTDTLDAVMSGILDEDWNEATKNYDTIVSKWKEFETVSEFFLDTEAVNEADELINKTRYHISTHDTSNSAADVSELNHMLRYLYENEILSTGNIF